MTRLSSTKLIYILMCLSHCFISSYHYEIWKVKVCMGSIVRIWMKSFKSFSKWPHNNQNVECFILSNIVKLWFNMKMSWVSDNAFVFFLTNTTVMLKFILKSNFNCLDNGKCISHQVENLYSIYQQPNQLSILIITT